MVFRFFNERKPGRRKNEPTSILEIALAKAESLLNQDFQKGLQYYRQAEQHYYQLDPQTPGYLEIEYRLGSLLVSYFQKRASLEAQPQSL